jgi:stage II sporulation protein AA (anti-sigma F factor antagonist)
MADTQLFPLTVHAEWDHGTAVISVAGELDVYSAALLSDCLEQQIDKVPERLIIDLAEAVFHDYSALHAFVRARWALPPRCPVIVRSPPPLARRIFELAGLESICIIEQADH